MNDKLKNVKMKAIATLLLICLIGCFAACTGQPKQPTSDSQNIVKSKKEIPKKQMNLLDEQTKVFAQIFNLAGAGEDNPLGNATNFQELIKNMDLPKDQKEMLREQ